MVQDDAGDTDREYDRGEGEVVCKPDSHPRDPSDAGARGNLTHLDRRFGVTSHLRANVLTLDARLVVKGENDRSDHRSEQYHPRRLKEVDIAGVEHLAERGRVA